MNRPLETEYAPSFQGYVAHVNEAEILPVLRSQIDELDLLFDPVTPERETYRYDEGKWSIREVVGHLIDGERVFGYRTLCIARGEDQNLPGFDENEYMTSAPYAGIELEDLLSEFRLVRLSNIAMIRNFDEAAWTRMGTANGAPISVRALAFIMAGHLRHHMKVLKERYLTPSADVPSSSAQPNVETQPSAGSESEPEVTNN
jgi:DinB family protein